MESNLEELFYSIENSPEYQNYKKMSNILSKDDNIKKQIEEIKELEQEATHLEHVGDMRYKDVDLLIKKKADILKENPVYQEYLSKMEEFNKELSVSSDIINDYLKEVV